MALDTVKIRSPFVTAEVAGAARFVTKCKRSEEVATGRVDYELFAGMLEGSFDHRVSLRVETERFVRVPGVNGSRPTCAKIPCPAYLVVEGSLHKAICGHNVWGGPEDIHASCKWLLASLEKRLGVGLPEVERWEVERADWAEVYDLGSKEAVEEYLGGLKLCQFPRRMPRIYDKDLYFAGTVTTVKAYHKGPDFHKHDAGRLRKFWAGDGDPFRETLEELREQADRSLRVEVELKSKRLDEDFGGNPLIGRITAEYLSGVHDREWFRVLREANTDMETVRTHQAVTARLFGRFSSQRAKGLFSTWVLLGVLGEKAVMARMPRATFYRQRKELVESGISWHGSDVQLREGESLIPEGFSPVRGDRRRMCGEHPLVREELRPYRLLA